MLNYPKSKVQGPVINYQYCETLFSGEFNIHLLFKWILFFLVF